MGDGGRGKIDGAGNFEVTVVTGDLQALDGQLARDAAAKISTPFSSMMTTMASAGKSRSPYSAAGIR